MKQSFDNNLTIFKRKYLADIFLNRVLVIWAIFAIVFIGFLGIRPLYIQIKEKRITITEMKEVNQRLQNNLDVLDNLGQDILTAGENIAYVYEYMPTEPNIQNYLVEMVNATTAVGFGLSQYNPEYRTNVIGKENLIEIETRFEGTGDIVDLAKSIEDLKRITSIKKFNFRKSETSEKNIIEVEVEIYHLNTK